MTTPRHFLISLGVAACILTGAHAARAAIISISPDQQSVAPGDTITADVRLNSEHEIVNAAQVRIQYDSQAVEVVEVSKASSFLTLWTEEPKVDAHLGVITFAGGTPNGSYVVNGRLVSVVFHTLQLGQTAVLIDEAASGVYLNDGLGTKAKLTVTPGTINVQTSGKTLTISSPSHPDENAWYSKSIVQLAWTAQKNAQYAYVLSSDPNALPDTRRGSFVDSATFGNVRDGTSYFILQEHLPNDTWSAPVIRRVNVDTTMPAAFTPKLTRQVVPGKLALVFATTDIPSSVIRWRVQEGDAVIENAASPYVLHDQTQKVPLTVTAYDAADNQQSATIAASSIGRTLSPAQRNWMIIGGAIVLAGGVAIALVRHRRQRPR